MVLLVYSFITSEAAIKLPKIFPDNMVLQRNVAVKIWGWSEKKQRGFSTLQWPNGKSKSACKWNVVGHSNANGSWGAI